jgi:transcription elongation factor GreA-like protein/transcription elongation GreA/GreB family factor
MSKKTLSSINEQLNEEKWTRATLNNYTVNNFKELDEIITKIHKEKLEEEVRELCEEHLKHSKNSIIALFISGIISLSKQLVDDSNLILLINIFSDNRKWQIVEYLCNTILEFGENKYALRTLAECYGNSTELEKQSEVWERLIRVDYDEAEIVKLLAEKREEEGNLEGTVEYYKKALLRFVNKKMFSNVKEIWVKLVEYAPDDLDFFSRVERKVATLLNEERAGTLMHLLFPVYMQREDWDNSIYILKKILEYEPKNVEVRRELVSCYKNKHKAHSQLDEYIRISNLNQNWRNVHDAINDFEKHIAFDVGNYVFHRSWGIGRINSMDDDVFIIDFSGKKNHRMSLKMAVNALKILENDHIWVLKGTMKKEDLKTKVKSDPAWALKAIIKSFDNSTNMKIVKGEIVPNVLSQGEWAKWNTEARKILKTDPAFGTLPDKKDQFEVREIPITYEEKTFNKFRSEKNFFTRLQTIQDFLIEVQPDSEYFDEMFGYFTGFAKSFSNVSEHVVSSFLLVQKIIAGHPYLNPGLNYDFEDLFTQIEDLPSLFARIEDNELKRNFLQTVKQNIKTWPQIYARLFPLYLSKFIIDELRNEDKWDILIELFNHIHTHYREYKEAFIWLARNFSDEPWFDRINISYEKVLICMIHLLDITFREISNRRDVSLNRKLNKQIHDFLFKEERLLNIILDTDEESISRLYTLVDDVKELDPSIRIHLKQEIKKKHPGFRFIGEAEREVVSRGLLVTRAGYEAKQKALRHIIEVEVPENSKDIGNAMAKGDLRENAEYKAALEKQDLLNSLSARFQGELNEARIFDESEINTSSISFGTKIFLRNMENDEIEEYIILGPWESEPSKKVISYLSPLGIQICNHKEGDELKFSINEKDFHYKIEKIEMAELKTL